MLRVGYHPPTWAGNIPMATAGIGDRGADGRGGNRTARLPDADRDHLGPITQNKPDVATGIVRNWIDNKGVDVIRRRRQFRRWRSRSRTVDAHNARSLFLISGSGSSDLTGKQCSPTSVQWTYDTYRFLERDGEGRGRARRHALVLSHGRLCLRPGAGARCTAKDRDIGRRPRC